MTYVADKRANTSQMKARQERITLPPSASSRTPVLRSNELSSERSNPHITPSSANQRQRKQYYCAIPFTLLRKRAPSSAPTGLAAIRGWRETDMFRRCQQQRGYITSDNPTSDTASGCNRAPPGSFQLREP